ncbi:hypothetical protein [Bartonella sp. CB74]|uniref:hypothetical protein n=1 Tax=Bartonella sp. CB74 TaxID=3113620 RepID=UPI002F96460E
MTDALVFQQFISCDGYEVIFDAPYHKPDKWIIGVRGVVMLITGYHMNWSAYAD